jgi:hypothetical protein
MASNEPQKHFKYRSVYKPGEIYWGLGIELETYVELENGIQKQAKFVLENQHRERYSVDYWKIYKEGSVKSVINNWIERLPQKENTFIKLPMLMNGHSFTKTDRYGQSSTTYERTSKTNPRFCGKTLLEDLSGTHPEVFGAQNIWWCFDGDSIEFMTQRFYNATIEDVISELVEYKSHWLTALQTGLHKLSDCEPFLQQNVKWPSKNHGFAIFHTNRNNIAIFNNGTYHFNITLPTYLDKDANIANRELFTRQHMNVARLFQWLSPFLIAKFGSGDIFGRLNKGVGFPNGSQRCCASRYVSVGMYDTKLAKKGKLVTVPYTRVEGRWYEKIYDNSACCYTILSELGVDINFNKHWNHGLEFRIFDWFPESELENVLRLLIWMCDVALTRAEIPVPQTSDYWNSVLARCVWEGGDILLSADECATFIRIFGVECDSDQSCTAKELYTTIWDNWAKQWNWSQNTCTSKMIRNPLPYIPRSNTAMESEVRNPTPEVVSVAPHGWCCQLRRPICIATPTASPANKTPAAIV